MAIYFENAVHANRNKVFVLSNTNSEKENLILDLI